MHRCATYTHARTHTHTHTNARTLVYPTYAGKLKKNKGLPEQGTEDGTPTGSKAKATESEEPEGRDDGTTSSEVFAGYVCSMCC